MSTDTLPPAYEEKQALQDIYDILAKNLQDPSIMLGVKGEVKNLGNTLWAFEREFTEVSRSLKMLGHFQVDGKRWACADQWKGYRDEYCNLIDESQKGAIKIKAEINKFTSIVIPVLQGSHSTVDKEKALEAFIKDLTRVGGDTADLDSRFQSLGQNVESFKDKFKSAVLQHLRNSIPLEKHKRIQEIDDHLNKLYRELSNITGIYKSAKNIVKQGSAPVQKGLKLFAVSATVIAALTAIIALAPLVGAALLAGAAAVGIGYTLATGITDHKAQKKEIRANIQVLLNEKKGISPAVLECDDPELLEVSATLEKLNFNAFLDIVERMVAIPNIGDMLANDAESLLQDIRDPKNNLDSKLCAIKSVFETVSFALDQFTLQQRPR